MTSSIPSAALERHIGILGKTGSGKSNTAKTIAERIMADNGRVCVLDPTGTWWGIRLSPDGKKPSRFKPVIFGGNHADIPISAEHGAAIGEAIATASSSAIIDTRLMTVGARTRFFTAFAEALLRKNSGPLHLIIDEAHLFAPQGRVNDPQSGAMLHAANNLVSLGRGIGLRITLISQRPAKLHKDSLTQVETLIAMRLIAPQDRNAINDWIGEWADPAKGKEIIASLPSLPTGTAWVWSPEIDVLERAKFPLAASFDSGKPTAQQQALEPIDVKEIGDRLDAIRQEALANDPARLRAEIASLNKKLAAAPAADPKAIETAEQRGYERGCDETYRKGGTAIRDLMEWALESIGGLSSEMRVQFNAMLDGRYTEASPRPPERFVTPSKTILADRPGGGSKAEPAPAAAPKTTTVVDHLAAGAQALTPAKRKILVALRELEAIGQVAPEKLNVAWFAEASPKSSAYANNLGAMRSAGLIEYPGQGTVALTDAGRAAEPARGAPSHAGIMDLVRSKVPPAQFRMIEALVAVYPDPMHNDRLASDIGASVTSSAFANNKGRLRSLGLIDYPAAGMVRAADLLFPGGSR